MNAASFCLSNALDRPINQFFRLCVREQIGSQIRSQFFTDFHQNAAQTCGRFDAYCLWDKPKVVLPILELVSGFPFRLFSGSGDHIFQQISTISHVQVNFSNADFVFNGK